MKIWDNINLSEALGIEININFVASGFEFDSRNVKPGDIFIALPGENGDGHQYIPKAIENGAVAVICNKDYENKSDKLIRVNDTKEALIALAKYKRKISKAKFIGVTGSNGKTSTKEMVYAVLSGFGKTHKNIGNFNNDLGLPITLCRMPDEVEYAVIEMGMNHKGEIKYLAEIVKPDIGIITTIGPVHIEFFGSVEEIAIEKSDIFSYNSSNMTAIINYDNPYYNVIKSQLEIFGVKNILEFGQNTKDIKLLSYDIKPESMYVEAEIYGHRCSYKLPVSAKHHIYNSFAAILVASELGLNIEKASKNIENMMVEYGRGKLYKANYKNINFTILDESYNANLDSMKSSIISLKDRFPNHRKLVILGDMKEIGESRSKEMHEALLDTILENDISYVILVGTAVKYLHDILPSDIKGPLFVNYQEVMNSNFNFLQNDDVILFKASNSVKLGNIVNYLTQNSNESCCTI